MMMMMMMNDDDDDDDDDEELVDDHEQPDLRNDSSLSATGQCCTGNLYSISQVATDDPFVSGNIRMH